MLSLIKKAILDFLEPCHCGFCEPETDADFMARLFHIGIQEADQIIKGAQAGNVRFRKQLSKMLGGGPDDTALVRLNVIILRARMMK